MDDELKKYLFDIKDSVESINQYLNNNLDFNNYKSNKMLRRAVEREYEIIGEALTRIIKIDPEIRISSKRQIIGMRNRVIHGYDKIDDEIVWGITIKHLPVLKIEIENLLNS
jgi:uncharacterized protein with HEPN domain